MTRPTAAPAETLLVTAEVEAELTLFLAGARTAFTALDPALQPLADAVANAVLAGGKRLRPAFAYWGWRARHNQQALNTVLPALAALELLHAFALVHDDVMDRSDTRRGQPTAHRALAATHRRERLRGDAEHFGQSAAILAGDLCLIWADQLMARAAIAPATLIAARRVYDEMRSEAVAGQYLDILGEHSRTWNVDRALRTARLKTAGYTVVRPLHFGAALAGPVPGTLLSAFTQYGTAIGEAFQLCDDLLGAFGIPEVTGKPVGDDLIQGKPTALLHLARSRATARQLAEIDHLRRRCATHETVDSATAAARLADIVRDTGAADQIESMIADRIETAQQALALAPLDDATRAALLDLAQSVTRRSA